MLGAGRLLARAVDVQEYPVSADRAGLSQVHGCVGAVVAEQSLARAENHREDHEPVFVGESGREQATDELAAAVYFGMLLNLSENGSEPSRSGHAFANPS